MNAVAFYFMESGAHFTDVVTGLHFHFLSFVVDLTFGKILNIP